MKRITYSGREEEKEKELKIVNILYGGEKAFRWTDKPNYIYNEVSKFLCYSYFKENNIHFVLGESNKDFLLKEGVPEKNIILVDKKSSVHLENASHFYNKTFLLNAVTEVLPENNILYLDYDCKLLKEFDKKDIYKIFKMNKKPIQSAVVCYHKRVFCSNGARQRTGLQTCLTYWNDHNLIKEWFKTHSKNPGMSNEPPLILTLDKEYGPMTLETLWEFDTTTIQLKNRPRYTDLFNENNYKDAYFYHN